MPDLGPSVNAEDKWRIVLANDGDVELDLSELGRTGDGLKSWLHNWSVRNETTRCRGLQTASR